MTILKRLSIQKEILMLFLSVREILICCSQRHSSMIQLLTSISSKLICIISSVFFYYTALPTSEDLSSFWGWPQPILHMDPVRDMLKFKVWFLFWPFVPQIKGIPVPFLQLFCEGVCILPIGSQCFPFSVCNGVCNGFYYLFCYLKDCSSFFFSIDSI